MLDINKEENVIFLSYTEEKKGVFLIGGLYRKVRKRCPLVATSLNRSASVLYSQCQSRLSPAPEQPPDQSPLSLSLEAVENVPNIFS